MYFEVLLEMLFGRFIKSLLFSTAVTRFELLPSYSVFRKKGLSVSIICIKDKSIFGVYFWLNFVQTAKSNLH